MGDRPGSPFRVRTSEDKVIEKTSVGLWGQSRDPRELLEVTGPSRGWVGVLHLVSEPTLAVTGACAGQMHAHVEHVPAMDAQTGAKRGSSWTGG